MSEVERSEVRDPEIPAMVFGRPPTRPGARDDEVPAEGVGTGTWQEGDVVSDGGREASGPRGDVSDGDGVPTEGVGTWQEGDVVSDGDREASGPGGDGSHGDEVPAEHAEMVPDGYAVSDGPGDDLGDGPLLVSADDLRQRWESVQIGFVDDPRAAVDAAAGMVSEATAALQAEIERRRASLADARHGEADGSTDALLAAFHDYRALFDRVVSV